MSYVWTANQIAEYRRYFHVINVLFDTAYVSYSTTRDFVRSVLPPCLEPTEDPQISIYFSQFIEAAEGVPNLPTHDRAAIVAVNAKRSGEEGAYYLSVIEGDEVNITSGREFWGMPKKQGSVAYFNNGKRLFGEVSRRGYPLVGLEAELGSEMAPPDAGVEIYFDMRGYFGVNAGTLRDAELVVFANETTLHRYRSVEGAKLTLSGSPADIGFGSIPLGAFRGGAVMGGETRYITREVVNLMGDGNDYTPYLMGRLCDEWFGVKSIR